MQISVFGFSFIQIPEPENTVFNELGLLKYNISVLETNSNDIKFCYEVKCIIKAMFSKQFMFLNLYIVLSGATIAF